MKQKKYVLLAGGGTGGHAAPILAIYERLSKNPKIDLCVVGVGSKEEKVFLENIPNYHTIFSGKIHRSFTLRNILELIKICAGLTQATVMLIIRRPDLVFSKGGYASLPIVFAARILRIPYYFHESDIEMGKTNRMMAKKAAKIFVMYPLEYYRGIPKEKMVFSGPILRESFYIKKAPNRKLFGFENDKPILLITGGSQGSLHLSNKIIETARELLRKYNIIHQAGKHSIEIAEKFRQSLESDLKNSYYVCDFLKKESGKDMMVAAIEAADLVIARSGSTIVEMAILGKPMILVPWKYSAQDHQLKNAQYFVCKKSAVMITDDQLTKRSLIEHVVELYKDKDQLKTLSLNAKKLFPNNGTEIICAEIIKQLEKK